MQINKKLLVVLPLIALVATACGNAKSGGSSSSTKSGSSGSTVSANNEPGLTSDSIEVGFTGPISGSAGLAGQGITAGMQIAADEINAAGGINGRKLKLDLLDDAYDPARTVANVRRLVSQDKVYALVAPAGSQALPGTWAFIKTSNTPVWGPISPTDPQQEQVYNLAATRTAQDEVAVDYFAQQGKMKIGFIGVDSDTGQGGLDAIHAQVPKHPGMSISSEAKVETGSTDVSSAVLQVLNSKPDAMIVAASNTQLALILKQIRSLGSKIPVAGDAGAAGTGGTNTTGPAGADASEGLIGGLQVALPTDTTASVKTWLAEAQKSTMPQAVSSFSIQGYGYLKSFAETIKRAGSDLSYDNFYKVADAMKSNPIDVGVMPPVACAPLPTGHTCSTSAALAIVTNGAWVPLVPFTSPK